MLQTPSSWTWAWHMVLSPWKLDEVMSCSTLQSSLCSPALLACAVSPRWYKSRGGTGAHGDSDQCRTAVLVFSLAGQTEPPGVAGCPEPSGNRVPPVLLPKQSPHPAGCRKDGGREAEGEEGRNEKCEAYRRLPRLDLPLLLLLQGGERR